VIADGGEDEFGDDDEEIWALFLRLRGGRDHQQGQYQGRKALHSNILLT